MVRLKIAIPAFASRLALPGLTAMMLSRSRTLLAAVALLTMVSFEVVAAESEPLKFDDHQLEFFEKDIRPILAKRCYKCHGPDAEEPGGGLYLTSRQSVLEGGDSGESIVVGKPDESLLIEAIRYEGLYEMPPKSKLPDDEIAKLEKWVSSGAPWTPGENVKTPKQEKKFDIQQRKADHWAWQPVTKPELPSVKNEGWAKDPIDRFILSKLEDKQLAPNGPADRITLLRRIYFDLTGMPPTREQIEAFQGDPSDEALTKVVDQLLASPRFGEHWGRHWLDLVRYSESRGHEFDHPIPNAYEYRDYVIRALNDDVPYNQLVTEHIAGDLIENPRIDPETGSNQSVIGTGFWHMGDWVHSPVDIRKDETDRFDNMLDVMNKAFLGLTVTCARCHDHKFDAISQADYYAQMGFLQSSAYCQTRFESKGPNGKIAAQLETLRQAYQQKAQEAYRSEVERLSGQWTKDLTNKDSAWSKELGKAEKDPNHPLHLWAKLLNAPENQVAGLTQNTSLPVDIAANYDGQIVQNYRAAKDTSWRTDGFVYGDGPRATGEFIWSVAGEPNLAGVRQSAAAVYDTRWAELKLAPGVSDEPGRLNQWNRAGRTLKTDTFPLANGNVHYLVKGNFRAFAAVDSHRMVAGPLHGVVARDYKTNKPNEWRWETHPLADYQGHAIHIEFSPIDGEPFEVAVVAEGATRPNVPDEKSIAAQAFAQATAQGGQPVPLFLATLKEAINKPEYAGLADWLVRNWNLVSVENASPLADLAKQYREESDKLLAQVQWQSHTAPGMWDNSAESEHLLIRGNSHNPAEPVERRLLTAISGDSHTFDPQGSGRLELARQMMDPANPFASRVIVNRIWHHLLGRGIVRSVDNFGVLGQEPTHPELLDYMASEFIADGWSLKRMIRRVMLSQTYQMSSSQMGSAEELDPKNDLFHRAEVKRLSGESIRDSLLMISGQLDEKMYGPSVPVYLTSFMQGRGRPRSGPLNGAGRRSIYISVQRNFLSPMMLAFDTPQPITTIGRRNQSNVPAQSLILLNDPFVVEQCELWAKKAIEATPDNAELRIDRMVEQAFSRPPTEAEQKLAMQFLDSHAQTLSVDPSQKLSSVQLWRDLAHVLVNAKPFIFVR